LYNCLYNSEKICQNNFLRNVYPCVDPCVPQGFPHVAIQPAVLPLRDCQTRATDCKASKGVVRVLVRQLVWLVRLLGLMKTATGPYGPYGSGAASCTGPRKGEKTVAPAGEFGACRTASHGSPRVSTGFATGAGPYGCVRGVAKIRPVDRPWEVVRVVVPTALYAENYGKLTLSNFN